MSGTSESWHICMLTETTVELLIVFEPSSTNINMTLLYKYLQVIMFKSYFFETACKSECSKVSVQMRAVERTHLIIVRGAMKHMVILSQ